jgi:hypothetical protein
MLTDQGAFPFDERVSAGKGGVPSQTSVESARPFDAQAHEIIDAIAAMVMSAQAGVRWLHVQPPDLEEVRQTLSNIATNGKRACELVVRLRSVVNQTPKQRTEAAPRVAGRRT